MVMRRARAASMRGRRRQTRRERRNSPTGSFVAKNPPPNLVLPPFAGLALAGKRRVLVWAA